MAKAPPITAYCATCDNQVSGGRTGSGHVTGQDNRLYCEECGEMMLRMERMFIPEGAIIKDPRTGVTTPMRAPVGGIRKPRSSAALKAVAPGGQRPATAAVPMVTPGSDPVAEYAQLIQTPPASTPPARTGGGFGKVIVLLVLAVGGTTLAWYLGFLPQLDPILGQVLQRPVDGPIPPRNDQPTPPANTITPPPANQEQPNGGGVVTGGSAAGVIEARDKTALEAALNQDAVVEGRVAMAGMAESGKTFLIRLGEDADSFEAVIQSRRFEQFKSIFGRDVAGALSGKTVRVSGKLFRVDDRIQIALDRPSQLEVVGD